MKGRYSQVQAMLAITRASLRSILRSPSAVVFSIGFPLVFILVFGFIGSSDGFSLNVAMDKKSDTSSVLYPVMKSIPGLRFQEKPDAELDEDLEKGNLTAIINIQKSADAQSDYVVRLKSSEAVNPQNLQVLQSVLNAAISNTDTSRRSVIVDKNIEKIPGRVYRRIDFILPGQLGFSLLSAGVFGVSFLFFNLRQQLVLKRFFATPVRRSYIVLGEALSRVIFQMITAVIIIGIGTLAFNFTLIHGWITFLEIMVLSFISLIVFMGYGFIVSSLAKNESTIPPFANMFTLPQFLLAGTFFPIDVFPKWLQFFCKLLPLTHFNDAMRNISYEGASLASCWPQIGVLLIWGIVLYGIAIKVFKWE